MRDILGVDVVIIGAGPAGLGCALSLLRRGVENLLVLEGSTVGASFLAWPREMRMVTPSFNANPFLQTDLNAIHLETSPADLHGCEHPSGQQYAEYLKAAVRHFAVPVRENQPVTGVHPIKDGFRIETAELTIETPNVIWAGGEFSHPRIPEFEGAKLCRHNSTIDSWDDLEGDGLIIIGGYESGMDAAFNLVQRGKSVAVISTGEPWLNEHSDPSESLSPYTRGRILDALNRFPKKLALQGNTEVVRVTQNEAGYCVELSTGKSFCTAVAPILATGFRSALTPVKELFEWDGGQPIFTEEDGSTTHSGLFYSGPSLVHRMSKFCFIYKFRARFGVVGAAIARRLELDSVPCPEEVARGFHITDIECCTDCECAIDSTAPEFAEVEVVH
jgi:thioredoxin reductase|tara:strand:- start:42062 stop:43228 length:1167 start_codon:yes stop_codon:yes gene_type:complete